ncbi:winged helix DNA-binding domain-containing protein [Conidiobolus coronatus NRRL 28638]|uniref:Winged helix DNA-binding domain-containing protein n=1 Tax=Conidiobolus coronatus (strain ATCC 28846 / CBS 209.66 / NRRL 28638) TaxID=796925 RepID=A0A137P7W3_CONC2|nr:winged helix DNA-binding domain-containing protein [Conidiobolus coronatus NRRL 28638]|eukprot:KXN71096.1 winged helix DNA-binding domain-containing protein [Conidiobolus coronatus NRRL 28638]
MKSTRITKKKCTFVAKLESLIDKCAHTGHIRWNINGDQIEFENTPEFQAALKSQFKVKNIDSFIRQLNIYCFKRTSDGRKQRKDGTVATYSFAHPFFLRCDPDLRERVKRDTSPKQKSNSAIYSSTQIHSIADSDAAESPFLLSNTPYFSGVSPMLENGQLYHRCMQAKYLECYNMNQMNPTMTFSSIPNSYTSYINNNTYLADICTEATNLSETAKYYASYLQNAQYDIDYTNQPNIDLEMMNIINEAEYSMMYANDTPQLFNYILEDNSYLSPVIYTNNNPQLYNNRFEGDSNISSEPLPMTPNSQY